MQDGQAPSRDRWQDGSRQSSPSRTASSPVDDRTYNVLQALTSTLESIESYEMYLEDDDNGLFDDLLAAERQHAERLLAELRSCLKVT
jgi:hypothetical protein